MLTLANYSPLPQGEFNLKELKSPVLNGRPSWHWSPAGPLEKRSRGSFQANRDPLLWKHYQTELGIYRHLPMDHLGNRLAQKDAPTSADLIQLVYGILTKCGISHEGISLHNVAYRPARATRWSHGGGHWQTFQFAVTLQISPRATYGVLIHELAHALVFACNGLFPGHGTIYRAVLLDLMARCFGDDVRIRGERAFDRAGLSFTPSSGTGFYARKKAKEVRAARLAAGPSVE